MGVRYKERAGSQGIRSFFSFLFFQKRDKTFMTEFLSFKVYPSPLNEDLFITTDLSVLIEKLPFNKSIIRKKKFYLQFMNT